MKKIKVGIIGATGSVGQRFVQLLAEHPWFELSALAASQRSAGKTYREACSWFLSADMPAKAAEMIVQPITTDLDCQLVFSAVPGSIARECEEAFAGADYGVLSNVSVHRQDEDVPLVTTEVNPEHFALLNRQRRVRGWSRGFIVTNANCSAMPLTITLAPLHRAFGIKSIIVHTMQAVSGAGFAGISSPAILDNIIPYIRNEEEKMPIETRKMLGTFHDSRIALAEFAMSAHCNRVTTLDGHMETVSVAFHKKPESVEDILGLWRDWHPLPQQLSLPSAPKPPIVFRAEPDRPQTRLDRNNGRGMAVTVGRLRPCEVLDYKYVLLGHNTIRGAAGASVLNAEYMLAQGLLEPWR